MPTLTQDGIAPLLNALRKDSEVDYIEPNQLARPQSVPPQSTASSTLAPPNDLFYQSVQWYLNDPIAGINATKAWQITTGSAAIVVGIRDSGVLFDHPELQGRLLPGYDMVSLLEPKVATADATLAPGGETAGI
jgi:serine protease